MVTTKDAISNLIHLLTHNGTVQAVRIGAAEGLGFAGTPEAVTTLARVAMDNTVLVDVRAAAAKALGHAIQRTT